MRRIGVTLAALVFLAGAVVWLSRQSSGRSEIRAQYVVFGGVAEVKVRTRDPRRAREALDVLGVSLQALHNAWHPWEDSDLTRLNAALARGETVQVSPLLRRPLMAAAGIYAESEGLFDPAIGGLIAMWGYHTSEYPVRSAEPDAAALATWRDHRPTFDDLVIDGSTVFSRNTAIQLDFNGIAEGLAVEEAEVILTARGEDTFLVTFGGDVYARCAAGEPAWQVAINDPRGGILVAVELGDREALFTTGSYARYREVDGTRKPHILDPRTGEPVKGLISVSVLHTDPVRADGASTSLLVAGADHWQETARRMQIDKAVVLTDSGELIVMPAMAARVAR